MELKTELRTMKHCSLRCNQQPQVIRRLPEIRVLGRPDELLRGGLREHEGRFRWRRLADWGGVLGLDGSVICSSRQREHCGEAKAETEAQPQAQVPLDDDPPQRDH